MRDHRLTVAEWLLEAGAGRSAVHVLGDLLGQRANELRRIARDAQLRPRCVYALVTLDDTRGCVVPLRPSPGRSRAKDPDLQRACDTALDLAREVLEAPALPALRFEFEEWLSIFGASLGLPAALAFLGYYAPSRLPPVAVVASGRLLSTGEIASVDGMDAKRAIADAEQGAQLRLMPDHGTLRDAVSATFGFDPMMPERHVLSLDEAIERARGDPDRRRAIGTLEALPFDGFSASDQVRILLELGTLHRHAGTTDRATALHERARALLDDQRRFIGGDAAERYELEFWLSEMDAFRIAEAVDALEARLAEPFLSAHNEVRCRGMLAQALGMAGRHREAVVVREANVQLQRSSEALRAVLPGTYCYLALDSARAGDRAVRGDATGRRGPVALRRCGDRARSRRPTPGRGSDRVVGGPAPAVRRPRAGVGRTRDLGRRSGGVPPGDEHPPRPLPRLPPHRAPRGRHGSRAAGADCGQPARLARGARPHGGLPGRGGVR